MCDINKQKGDGTAVRMSTSGTGGWGGYSSL